MKPEYAGSMVQVELGTIGWWGGAVALTRGIAELAEGRAISGTAAADLLGHLIR